jgi:quinol monooxygenase YgiN
MLIVTGSVTGREDSFGALKEACLEHVRRSRTEPGCISHAVAADCENPLRLVFFEEWTDRAALEQHFAVPAVRAFVKSLASFATASAGPTIHIVND